LGTCVNESLHGVDCFYHGMLILCQSHMTFIRVSLVEVLCRAVMGWAPALEYMLLGAHGLLRPCPIMSALEVAASRGPEVGSAYPLLKAPRRG
jgi:hypothetical protein